MYSRWFLWHTSWAIALSKSHRQTKLRLHVNNKCIHIMLAHSPVLRTPFWSAGPFGTTFLICKNSSSRSSPPTIVKPKPRGDLVSVVVSFSPDSSAGFFVKKALVWCWLTVGRKGKSDKMSSMESYHKHFLYQYLIFCPSEITKCLGNLQSWLVGN